MVTVGTVGVVGLGQMGAGIAEVFARTGLRVVGVEADDALVERGRGRLAGSLERAVSRGRLAAEERDAVLGRLDLGTDRSRLAEADLVIEAVPERLEVKAALFAELDRICPPATILATNTSSLSVTEIAVATSRPGRVVGMHFFNPAPVMRLVEVVRTVVTDAEVVAAVEELARRCGKTPVSVRDRAGFVANWLLLGYLNAAARAYGEGQVGREDLDAAMTGACGLPMGPLTLMDLIGLDTCLEVLETMYAQSREPRHAPAPVLRQLVTAGQLGRKTGRGFYAYAGRDSGTVADPAAPRETGAPGRVGVLGTPGPVLARLEKAGLDAVPGGEGCDVVLVEAGADGEPLAATAGAAADPGAVVGMRAPRTGRDHEVVEVARTALSRDAAVAAAHAACAAAGLSSVGCRDRAGGVVEALLYPHLNDAVRLVEECYATPDDVDAAMTLGCGYPQGPAELVDAVGAGVLAAGLRAQYDERREPHVAPAALLRQLVTLGRPLRDGSAA